MQIANLTNFVLLYLGIRVSEIPSTDHTFSTRICNDARHNRTYEQNKDGEGQLTKIQLNLDSQSKGQGNFGIIHIMTIDIVFCHIVIHKP